MEPKQTPFPDYDPRPYKEASGKQIKMKRGNRQTTPDPSILMEGLADLLKVWELNRQHRLKAMGRGKQQAPISQRMKGLFGGGR